MAWNELPARARALLDVWFGADDDPARLHHKQIWFRSTPEFDAEVQRNFASDHDAAVAGAYAGWEAEPESALALVMLLDQVPRNIFRSTPRAFASDPLALAVTNRALARGFDERLPAAWRLFFYLPLEHSEVLADQQRGLDLVLALPPVPGRATDGKMTRLHCEIIERFGRFPHRNVILGRISTAEELAFLIDCEHRFGQPTIPPPIMPAGSGPSGADVDDQAADLVNPGAVAGIEHGGGRDLFDQRRAVDLVPRQ
ncbi:MAG: DUF924 domain-containing protein [Alphaproteobacteria bacterium]|nr:DUF924 domain-containing protein [Alphaproteobacteria bacterium]